MSRSWCRSRSQTSGPPRAAAVRNALAAACAATLALGLGACSEQSAADAGAAAGQAAGSAADAAWPAGTVLAVDDVPITAEEIDRASAWFQPLDRKATPEHLRRLALTNVVLPRVLAAMLAPVAREEALRQCRAAAEDLRQGRMLGPPAPDGLIGTRLEGGFRDLGFAVWGTAMELEPEQWSEPVEDAGRFVLLRRLKVSQAPVPLAVQATVDLLAFPYMPPGTTPAQLDAAYDAHRLRIVDPAWRAIVPELIQYRMGVHAP